jgi:hypothetical protein
MDPTQRRNSKTQRRDATPRRNAASQRKDATGGQDGRARREGTTSVVPHSRNASHSCHPERSEGSAFEFRCSPSRPWILAFDFQLSTVNLRIPHGLRNTSRVLTQPRCKRARRARHAVPLLDFRLSTVDSRSAYFAAGFSGLNTPCGLSFQIQAWTSQGVFATKCPPFSVHCASFRL